MRDINTIVSAFYLRHVHIKDRELTPKIPESVINIKVTDLYMCVVNTEQDQTT